MQILTFYERQQIEYYLRLKMGRREIGRRLKRDHSVIVREIHRHTGVSGRYRAELAQEVTDRDARRTNRRKLEKDRVLHDHVIRALKAGRSPDVIAGRLKKRPPAGSQGRSVSHEAIYRYIYEGAGRFEGLFHHLRYKRPKRQGRHSRKVHKQLILQRVSIHERPEEAASRRSFGHWESDSVSGYRTRKQRLSVQVERKARLVRLHRVAPTARETETAIRKTVDSLPAHLFKTITFDNGGENATHMTLRQDYNIDTYFCDPYASWQKGGVENMNRMIRWFLPRKTDLSVLTNEEIYTIQETLNDYPRKSLNYLSPNEVVSQYLSGVVH